MIRYLLSLWLFAFNIPSFAWGQVTFDIPPFGQVFYHNQFGSFHQTGTIPSGWANLSVIANGNPPGHVVTLELGTSPVTPQMYRRLEAKAGTNHKFWSDPGFVPFADFQEILFSTGTNTCGAWSVASSSLSATFNSASNTITVDADADFSGDGTLCLPSGHMAYHFDYYFYLPNPTTYTISGVTGSPIPPGSQQSKPKLPNSQNPTTRGWVFTNPPSGPASGTWYDPPLASGYRFEASGPGTFSAIAEFPSGIDDNGRFSVHTQYGVTTWLVHQRVDFMTLYGSGVQWFEIHDISPAVEADNPLAFPIKLEFDGAPSQFEMIPMRR